MNADEQLKQLTPIMPSERLVIQAITTPSGRPCWFPADAILTREDVAALLEVSVRTVQEYPIRCAYPSPTKPRYLYRDVVAFLNSRAA